MIQKKIEMVRRNGGTYKLDHAVTKTQKSILSSFGLDETSISKSTEEISKLLAACQSLMNKEVSEDGGFQSVYALNGCLNACAYIRKVVKCVPRCLLFCQVCQHRTDVLIYYYSGH